MVSNARACEDLEPRVTHFFKIMFEPNFSEALFLPPKFASSVKDLVNQETKLEDSSGTCWAVTLSYYKEKLAFHEGWFEFSVGKGLQVGDFLVFKYVKAGHFFVQAFGRDGIEKLNSIRKCLESNKAQTSNTIAAEKPCQTTCPDARERKSSYALVEFQPTTTNCTSNDEGGNEKQLCMDNSCYLMIDRDAEYVPSDYRTCLYDLSIFEMQQKKCSAGETEKCVDGEEGNPDQAQTSEKPGADGDLADRNPIGTAVLGMETANARDTDTVEKEKDSGPVANMSPDCDLPIKLADNCVEGDDISNVAIPRQNPRRSRENLNKAIIMVKKEKVKKNAQASGRGRKRDKAINMVKKDKVEMRDQPSGRGRKRRVREQASHRVQKRVLRPSTREKGGTSSAAAQKNNVAEVEPDDSLYVPSSVAASITCLAETNGSVYITLPDPLPSVRFKGRQCRAAVVLQDPEGREWPGVYHEKSGFCVLVTGWAKVNAANGIRAGDLLVFSIADASLNKYKIDIVRKEAAN